MLRVDAVVEVIRSVLIKFIRVHRRVIFPLDAERTSVRFIVVFQFIRTRARAELPLARSRGALLLLLLLLLEPRHGRPTTDDDDEHRAPAGTTTRRTRTNTDDDALSREGDEGTRRRRGTGRAHDWARRARERAHVCLHIPSEIASH